MLSQNNLGDLNMLHRSAYNQPFEAPLAVNLPQVTRLDPPVVAPMIVFDVTKRGRSLWAAVAEYESKDDDAVLVFGCFYLIITLSGYRVSGT